MPRPVRALKEGDYFSLPNGERRCVAEIVEFENGAYQHIVRKLFWWERAIFGVIGSWLRVVAWWKL